MYLFDTCKSLLRSSNRFLSVKNNFNFNKNNLITLNTFCNNITRIFL